MSGRQWISEERTPRRRRIDDPEPAAQPRAPWIRRQTRRGSDPLPRVADEGLDALTRLIAEVDIRVRHSALLRCQDRANLRHVVYHDCRPPVVDQRQQIGVHWSDQRSDESVLDPPPEGVGSLSRCAFGKSLRSSVDAPVLAGRNCWEADLFDFRHVARSGCEQHVVTGISEGAGHRQ